MEKLENPAAFVVSKSAKSVANVSGVLLVEAKLLRLKVGKKCKEELERREETIIISRGFSTRVSRVCLFTIKKAERNPPPLPPPTFLFFFENHWINVHCVFALFSTQPSTAAEAKCHTFSIWGSFYQTDGLWFQSKDRICNIDFIMSKHL